MNGDDSAAFQILRALRRIIRRTSEYSRSVARQGGVSVPQLLCLKAIADAPPGDVVTVAGIASAVRLSAPTVSRILDRMEKAGMLVRERMSADRRKVNVSLTAEGRRRLASVPVSLHEVFLERLLALGPAERTQLLEALERIVELLGAEQLDASPLLTPEVDVGGRSMSASASADPAAPPDSRSLS